MAEARIIDLKTVIGVYTLCNTGAVLVHAVDYAEDKILAISHCNCLERALMVRDAIAQRVRCKKMLVVDTAGISSMYASDGGIIVVV